MNRSFCGRFGPSQSGAELSSTLRTMGNQLAIGTTAQPEICTSRQAGLAAIGDQHILHERGPIIASFSGRPHWSCADLQRVAGDRGFAASLVTAYERHGADFLDRLHGPFAVALLNTETSEAIIAIDRLGICQLYFTWSGRHGLTFGNSARSMLALESQRPQLRQQAVFEYLYFHMVPSPGTIYEDYEKLGLGECIVVRDGSLSRRRYWSPEFNDGSHVNRNNLEEQLRHQLREAVSRCLPKTMTGCFLSGGIDSSTVAGIVSELRPPARTFTIGFDQEGYDESSFAKVTADHFGTQHTQYTVTAADVADILPTIAASYDEPFGNSSVVPTYYCARLAKENGIETLLGGDGGDELFGGNVRYVTQQVFDIYNRVPAMLRRGLIEPLAFGIPGAAKFPPTRKLQSYVRQAKVPMPDRLQTYNYFSRSSVDEILHPEFLDQVNIDGPLESMRETYQRSTANSLLNRMLEFDWKYTLADNDLRKVGRMCELAGVSVQYPFLDDELVALSARIPPRLKISRYRLRHFVKHALRDFLPDEVLNKSKHGFGLPFGIWMQSFAPLRDLAYDCLSHIGDRNIINHNYLDSLIHAHRSEHAHYYGEFIWVLMMLELWLRSTEELPSSGPSL
ncbi:MAG: asparagine synthase-related protein [Woeseiaceae bacterium]|nr:asparagine synthase-related protein [Woeseiaceae bacterium]